MADEKLASDLPPEATATPLEDVAAIPLIEERLSITKRQVEADRIRVRVKVEEEEEVVTEQLVHDDLHIERVPKGERVTEVPRVRVEGNTTVVPVVKETVVVEKALVLVEEIHITRQPVSEPAEIAVKLRTERAHIERDSASETPPAEDNHG